jgi:hypothetical protein
MGMPHGKIASYNTYKLSPPIIYYREPSSDVNPVSLGDCRGNHAISDDVTGVAFEQGTPLHFNERPFQTPKIEQKRAFFRFLM